MFVYLSERLRPHKSNQGIDRKDRPLSWSILHYEYVDLVHYNAGPQYITGDLANFYISELKYQILKNLSDVKVVLYFLRPFTMMISKKSWILRFKSTGSYIDISDDLYDHNFENISSFQVTVAMYVIMCPLYGF